MCCVEGENGEDVPLTVIEYIYYSLQDGGYVFHDSIYRQMFDEAVAHRKDPGFVAEQYFLNHADPRIGNTAFELSTDREQVSRVYGEAAELRPFAVVPTMVANMKLQRIRAELKSLIEQTKNPELLKNREAFRQLMEQYNEKKRLAEALAKEAGEQVVLR
jgi:DNA primase